SSAAGATASRSAWAAAPIRSAIGAWSGREARTSMTDSHAGVYGRPTGVVERPARRHNAPHRHEATTDASGSDHAHAPPGAADRRARCAVRARHLAGARLAGPARHRLSRAVLRIAVRADGHGDRNRLRDPVA